MPSNYVPVRIPNPPYGSVPSSKKARLKAPRRDVLPGALPSRPEGSQDLRMLASLCRVAIRLAVIRWCLHFRRNMGFALNYAARRRMEFRRTH
jgi:hypothetical protein